MSRVTNKDVVGYRVWAVREGTRKSLGAYCPDHFVTAPAPDLLILPVLRRDAKRTMCETCHTPVANWVQPYDHGGKGER